MASERLLRHFVNVVVVATTILAIRGIASACSMKTPTYSVTDLRGRVVGGFFGEHVQGVIPRWFERLFSVGGAELVVYEYIPDSNAAYMGREVARVFANQRGDFAFPRLAPGRYVLKVRSGSHLGAFFYVDIKSSGPQTRSVTIDASPLLSDCSGGDYMLVDVAASN